MREIVIDTETTGLSPREGHRIVEIGCIELENFIPTKNIFHKYINPERTVSEDAIKIHGYSNEFLSKQVKFSEIADDFLNFIKEKKLIIHNAAFDLSFLNHELKLINKNSIKLDNVIDTLEIARGKFPGSPNSLDALCKRFRIDNSKRTKHSALVDCELLSKVYLNLFDQKEPKLNFFLDSQNQNLNKEFNSKNNQYSKKIITPNQEEIKTHNVFLKNNLKKNYF